MCGIGGFWARESVPGKDIISVLLEYGEKRGSDGFGYSVYNPDDEFNERKMIRYAHREDAADLIESSISLGGVVIMNHRAAPETEVASSDNESIQPVTNQKYGISLVHNGAVSNSIYNKLIKEGSELFGKYTNIDSEAIIWSYLHNDRNMKMTMEYLSGGFAFALVDSWKNMLYLVCTHNPLFCGYSRGYGLWFSSLEEGAYEALSVIKGNKVERMNVNVWEDYYVRELPANTITEIDLKSGMINEKKFEPRYIHPNYDPYDISTYGSRNGKRVLVSSSGGLDSSTTLAILKYAGYQVTAVHFKYGHRGQEAEEIAIKTVTDMLDIPLVKFDLENQMKLLDSGMLTNKDIKITTGTEEGLKTTIAWTCFRNGFFVTYMGALAEKLIIDERLDEVYITGGFMQLTESGTYPDNSERFINSFIKFAKFASICGTRIKPIYACANLLKTEQYIILNQLGLLNILSPWLISCDRPKVINGLPYNCSKNGEPACGSGLLSYWASKMAGVPDLRRYYEIEGEYKSYKPPSTLEPKIITIEKIIEKLEIHQENKTMLAKEIKRIQGSLKQ